MAMRDTGHPSAASGATLARSTASLSVFIAEGYHPMPTYRVGGFGALVHALAAHQAARDKRVRDAVERTAKAGVGVVKRHAPVAFGELRESTHARGTTIVVDAPYAADVELGSRPHTPALGPLIRWVKLRAAQGLLSERERGRLPGPTTRAHAESVSGALAGLESGGALDVDAPIRIAKAIQHAISLRGTKPTFFARSSLPEIRTLLHTFLHEALR
jgi:hypothetical protein